MPDTPAAVTARSFWSGTITFGLVSIPVEFYAGARARQKSMKMVDEEGHPLGRQYTRENDTQPLGNSDIVRGFETDEGKVVVITDEEFEAAAPETSRDIDLHSFVPLAQIPPSYFVRPYYLAPGARSAKAYVLLAQTMQATGKVGVGRFVMRGHEYLVAIIAEGGLLRAETLRYFDELRTPEGVGLPPATRPAPKLVKEFAKEVERLREGRLDLHELEDREAEALHAFAERKYKQGTDVISLSPLAADDEEQEGGAQIVDLVALLRRSLGAADRPDTGSANGTKDKIARVPARKASAAAAEKAPARGKAPAARHKAASDLADRTREALYKIATDFGISGRSKMSKEQLIEAIQDAEHKTAA